MIAPSPTKTEFTTIRPVPKPAPRPIVGGRAAYRLAQAQGRAFEDVAADQDAADVLSVSRMVDRRRDGHIRQALRLVRLARKDRDNSASYLCLADGHLSEAIRLDRITDEHDEHAERHVGVSLEAGRAVIAVHEELLTGHVKAEAS